MDFVLINWRLPETFGYKESDWWVQSRNRYKNGYTEETYQKNGVLFKS